MKNAFNFILSLIALIFIVLQVLFLIPAVGLTESEFMMSDFMLGIMSYGPIFLLALFAVVNFFERSFKIVFFILALFAIAALIIGFFFPELFSF